MPFTCLDPMGQDRIDMILSELPSNIPNPKHSHFHSMLRNLDSSKTSFLTLAPTPSCYYIYIYYMYTQLFEGNVYIYILYVYPFLFVAFPKWLTTSFHCLLRVVPQQFMLRTSHWPIQVGSSISRMVTPKC